MKAKVRYDDKHPPEGWGLSEEDWRAIPSHLRHDHVRRCFELKAGIAMHKDRSFGREKYDDGGFCGLHVREHRLRSLELEGKPNSPALAALRKEVAEYRERLAPEEARLIENEEIFKEFGSVAERAGLTVPGLLRRYKDVEDTLRRDFVGGMIKTCDMVGIDFLTFLLSVQNDQQPAARH